LSQDSHYGFGVIDWLLLVAVFLVGAVVLIPYTVSEKQDKSIQVCVKNLREIDKAMRLWQLDKAKPMETAVTFSEIATYLGGEVSTNCPSGGRYIVTGLTNPPACTIPGHALANEGGD
jgi:hypothetical protein